MSELQTALDETHRYLDNIHLKTGTGPLWEHLVNMMQALDHLQRIHERCEEDKDRAQTAQTTTELANENTLLLNSIEEIMKLIQTKRWLRAAELARRTPDKFIKK